MIDKSVDRNLYRRMHRKVRRLRGPATAQTCGRCPRQARDWASVHTEDGTDPWADYIALCRSCHRAYDGLSTVAGDARRGVPMTQGHKDKIAAGRTGKRHSEGTKIRLRSVAAARLRDEKGRLM